MATKYISNKEIYEEVISKMIPLAKSFLWIATADMKDLHVKEGDKFVPFLKVLSNLLKKGISIRILHAKEPGVAFRKDFDKYPNLINDLEMMLCPRNHTKMVIVDGISAFVGSANLTGSGMGAKSETKRNFESGIITDENDIINPMMEQFDNIWMGRYCDKCKRKEFCFEYLNKS